MAAALLIAAAFLVPIRASVVELNCSDNATCIDHMAREFVRSVRQQKTVRLFDTVQVEPIRVRRQARSEEGPLTSFLGSHAFSFDWNDFTFKLWKAQDRNDAIDLEIFESRSAKDVSEEIPKKSKSKVEEEEEDHEDKSKSPKGIIRRRAKKKIMQAVIPMLFGMKTSAAVIFAMAVVSVLTLKAFVASQLALVVTIGMAVKRLYESWGLGVGLNHPYLYSQYPIDFPSASSHAYSVSGVSPQFPEMYNPTAMGTHTQTEMLQHNDASAQQSQQAPSVQLLNSTRASERWDGKSKLQKLLEPLVVGIKSYIDPIANVFYAMPATFRGLNSDVTTMKSSDAEDEEVKKPREFLVPQPRYYAQRKMNYRKYYRHDGRPKKYTELKIDLDKLKTNKDLRDYLKTKKYKYNYQHTFYYPRVKFFVSPNTYYMKPKTNRLIPYRKINSNISISNNVLVPINMTAWKPVVLVPIINATSIPLNITKNIPQKFSKPTENKSSRVKRDLANYYYEQEQSESFNEVERKHSNNEDDNESDADSDVDNIFGRGFFDFIATLIDADPISAMVDHASLYTKKFIKNSLKSSAPPRYYTIAYEMLMMSLDVLDGLVQVHQALSDHFFRDLKVKKSTIKKKEDTHTHNKLKKKKDKKKNKNKNKNKNKHSSTEAQESSDTSSKKKRATEH